MIVVSDATPINHLVQSQLVSCLPAVVGQIVLPESVFEELNYKRTPEVVKAFVATLPSWISVSQVSYIFDAELDQLDKGERDAILLTEEIRAEGLLIDERKGRQVAKNRNLRVIGTISILERAAIRNLLIFEDALDALLATGFYLSANIKAEFLRRSRLRSEKL